ncbi:AMP-binding C domain containing protein, partial [Asbolus verrucosus]
PSIQEVAVVGKPDKRSGEVAVGFVVKKTGSRVSEKVICDYLSEFVCTEKRLHGGVQFIDVIPKNLSGKILRKKLRKMFE